MALPPETLVCPLLLLIVETVEAFERALIADALRRYGSLSRTADALAIAKTTLHDKIRKYGLGDDVPA